MKDSKSLTPMMRQYFEVKKSLPPKTLLFFRRGDFYELFNEDAEIGARLLNLTFTRRGTMPMAGNPYQAATSYINRI
jgi:DNA mismatch repair protein MutS